MANAWTMRIFMLSCDRGARMFRCESVSLRVAPRLMIGVAVCSALSACSVFTVVDTAVDVAATTVKVGATVVETTVDVAAAGVKAATQSASSP
jgi:hypothetical protein